MRAFLTGCARVLEINTGLICSCTPTLKPFVKHIMSTSSFKKAHDLLASNPKDGLFERSPQPKLESSMFVISEGSTQKPDMVYFSQVTIEEV